MCQRIKRECYQNASGKARANFRKTTSRDSHTTRATPLEPHPLTVTPLEPHPLTVTPLKPHLLTVTPTPLYPRGVVINA